MSVRPSWLIAGDLEYRYRVWVFALLFFAAFEMYWWDHISAAGAVAHWIARHVGSDAHLLNEVILFLGVAMTLTAAALRTWAAAYMRSDVVHDPRVHDSRLVADGPYRHVRNPLYLGTTLMAAGVGLAASRSGFVLLVLAVWFFQYRLILREERALEASQGEGYRRYLMSVPRFMPSVRPCVSSDGMRPQWGQAMRGEMFMWAFVLTFVLYAATTSMRVLMWGCVTSTAIVLLMRRRAASSIAEQAAERL